MLVSIQQTYHCRKEGEKNVSRHRRQITQLTLAQILQALVLVCHRPNHQHTPDSVESTIVEHPPKSCPAHPRQLRRSPSHLLRWKWTGHHHKQLDYYPQSIRLIFSAPIFEGHDSTRIVRRYAQACTIVAPNVCTTLTQSKDVLTHCKLTRLPFFTTPSSLLPGLKSATITPEGNFLYASRGTGAISSISANAAVPWRYSSERDWWNNFVL